MCEPSRETGRFRLPRDDGESEPLSAPLVLSDQTLLERLSHGDAGAFSAFYDRHASRILGLLVRLLGNRTSAEDVLQEVFVQVWSQAGTYDPQRGSPVLWLVMIARSRARDWWRRHSRLGEAALELGDVPESAASRGGDLEQSESAELARQALALLPDEQRTAIRLAFFQGLTHVQIADLQRIALGTVKTRIRLGIRKLREIFENRLRAVAS